MKKSDKEILMHILKSMDSKNITLNKEKLKEISPYTDGTLEDVLSDYNITAEIILGYRKKDERARNKSKFK